MFSFEPFPAVTEEFFEHSAEPTAFTYAPEIVVNAFPFSITQWQHSPLIPTLQYEYHTLQFIDIKSDIILFAIIFKPSLLPGVKKRV